MKPVKRNILNAALLNERLNLFVEEVHFADNHQLGIFKLQAIEGLG